MEDSSLLVKRMTLVDAVVEQMVEAIKSGRFKPGEKIPSEKVLTKEFGVSRTTLREAFKKLENCGALSIKQGNGTYLMDVDIDDVISPSEAAVQEAPHRMEELIETPENRLIQEAIRAMFTLGNYRLTHYIEARETVESKAIKLGVERITKDDIDAIGAILSAQDACDDPEEFLQLDYDFHMRIIMTSKNEFLYQFWMALGPFFKEQLAKSYAIPGMTENATLTHRKLFNELVKGNAKRALAINEEHLRMTQGRMLSQAAMHVSNQNMGQDETDN